MDTKTQLRTVRFPPKEAALVDKYLNKNKVFESFSVLARIATLSFISEANSVHLNPVILDKKAKRPQFLWDYDLTDIQVREILASHGLTPQKRWLLEKILLNSRFEDVLKYASLSEIEKALPSLRLSKKIKDRWEYALRRWKTHSKG